MASDIWKTQETEGKHIFVMVVSFFNIGAWNIKKKHNPAN